ncbi:hypothetical protein [Agromyces mariniharenae]|uniref:Uncharacterized protein n=1 Tax=Agromyces mariniharenae TaxID=2604423 RepID=A0A5S4V3T8_9MICO|nr:hypothetical protein [Agromyces mariniharenae]TYL51170.1 hypothetical protein FYC51_18815 [Agromyces mariniharenae]
MSFDLLTTGLLIGVAALAVFAIIAAVRRRKRNAIDAQEAASSPTVAAESNPPSTTATPNPVPTRTATGGSGRPGDKYLEERTFSMPCTPEEAISVIAAQVDTNGQESFGVPLRQFLESESPGQPPLVHSIYVSEFNPSTGLTLVAGNRVNTYWKAHLQLDGANPVTGTFSVTQYDRTWIVNIVQMVGVLESSTRSVGGQLLKWPK